MVRMMIRQPRPGCDDDAPGGFQAIHLRHPDVHEDHVGTVFRHRGDRFGAVGGLGVDRAITTSVTSAAGRAAAHVRFVSAMGGRAVRPTFQDSAGG